MRYVELKNCQVEPTNVMCPACQANLLQKITTTGSALLKEDYTYFFICSNTKCNFLGSPDVIQVPIIYERLEALHFINLDFSISAVQGYAPLTVTCQARPFGITTNEFIWDFGDGTIETTTDVKINHVYNNPGVYSISLSCLNVSEVKTYTCKKDNVLNLNTFLPPVANFTASKTTGSNTLSVKFTDHSTGSEIVKWLWDFGDGETSTEQHPTHYYAQPGKYTVSLTCTNVRSTSDTKTSTNLIDVLMTAPVAQFSVDRSSGYTPLTVKFTYSGAGKYFPDKYKWTFGDGTTSEEASPTHIYTVAGAYDVQLEVYNSMGSDAILKQNVILAQSPTII